jgi:hypothetical protein
MTNYTEEEKKLAQEFADALDDQKSIAMHRSYVRLYEEWSLREQLKEVLDKPDNEVRTNRAAYYNYKVQTKGVLKNSR